MTPVNVHAAQRAWLQNSAAMDADHASRPLRGSPLWGFLCAAAASAAMNIIPRQIDGINGTLQLGAPTYHAPLPARRVVPYSNGYGMGMGGGYAFPPVVRP